MTTAVPLWIFFRRHAQTVPGACVQNFKSIALDVLKLLAFEGQKLRCHMTLFKKSILRDHVATDSLSMCAKLEVRIFSLFGAINTVKNLRGNVILAMLFFENIFRGHVGSVSESMPAKF